MTSDDVASWAALLKDVAACPNVVCKLGGLAMVKNGHGIHEREAPVGAYDLNPRFQSISPDAPAPAPPPAAAALPVAYAQPIGKSTAF